VDPLSDVLRAVRLTGAWFFLVEATSPWWSEVADGASIAPSVLPGAQHLVSYHVITEGRCWAGLADGTEAWLEAGDVVVFPHGDAYAMSTAPGRVGGQPVEASREFFRELAAGRLPLRLTEGGGGAERVHAVCGFLGCDIAPFNPILAALPRLLHVHRPRAPGGERAGDRLTALLDLALAEWSDRQAGSDCVLLRISEVLFVEVVRRHLASLGPGQTGWLAGLRDPVVGRALRLLHQEPARPWTVETLAHQAGLSRSALAERFTHFIGQPPMQYLARWRMQVAARLLADGTAKVSAVAFDVGYESEAAFSRAFKKAVGIPPAAWRDRHAGALRAG
jgi:AraC-like DNA-binding protein